MTSRKRILIGTRKSRLALAQSQLVADAIVHAHPNLQVLLYPIVTQGDIKIDKPLPLIGGKGLFTFELEQALQSGQIDLAVHSAKDLPTASPPSLDILCVPARAAVEDVLVTPAGLSLADLWAGARIGTSSLRRQLQLHEVRPDLQFVDIRGNIDTRVQKAFTSQYDGVILAQAGLVRAGMTDVPWTVLPTDMVLPAPGQAVLAIQGRVDDGWLREILTPINDPAAAPCLAAERSLLSRLALDCHMPFAALCERPRGTQSTHTYRLRTWVAEAKAGRSFRTDACAATWQEAVEEALTGIESSGRHILEALRKKI